MNSGQKNNYNNPFGMGGNQMYQQQTPSNPMDFLSNNYYPQQQNGYNPPPQMYPNYYYPYPPQPFMQPQPQPQPQNSVGFFDNFLLNKLQTASKKW